jgi:hypothetical protein
MNTDGRILADLKSAQSGFESQWGHWKRAGSSPAQAASIRSTTAGSSVAVVTKTTSTSSSVRSGRPTTLASLTPGTEAMSRSISAAETFSAPTFSLSLSRWSNER